MSKFCFLDSSILPCPVYEVYVSLLFCLFNFCLVPSFAGVFGLTFLHAPLVFSNVYFRYIILTHPHKSGGGTCIFFCSIFFLISSTKYKLSAHPLNVSNDFNLSFLILLSLPGFPELSVDDVRLPLSDDKRPLCSREPSFLKVNFVWIHTIPYRN